MSYATASSQGRRLRSSFASVLNISIAQVFTIGCNVPRCISLRVFAKLVSLQEDRLFPIAREGL